jgi:hypothetical protein
MDAAFSIQNRRSIKQFNYKALWPATKKRRNQESICSPAEKPI